MSTFAERIQVAKELMVKVDTFSGESYAEDRHAWFTEAYDILSHIQYDLGKDES